MATADAVPPAPAAAEAVSPAPTAEDAAKAFADNWVNTRPKPPFPFLLFHCTNQDTRTFSHIGLRVAGYGGCIDASRADKVGALADSYGTCACSMVPRKVFYEGPVLKSPPPPGSVEIVDRAGACHTWTMEEFLGAVICHSVPGGPDFLPAERGGPCAIVSKEDKVITNLESITINLTESAESPVGIS